MELNEALKLSGFVLCEFTWDGREECATCEEVQPEGTPVYYERTCYEVNEGDYHCEQCTRLTPERWEMFDKLYEGLL